jgi:hypothetical protein
MGVYWLEWPNMVDEITSHKSVGLLNLLIHAYNSLITYQHEIRDKRCQNFKPSNYMLTCVKSCKKNLH